MGRVITMRMGTGAALTFNTVAPVVSGTATVGQTLSCTTGTWTNTPTSYAYQWLNEGANISGATSSTYVLQSSDENFDISCRVTASNTSGAGTPAVSNEVGPILGGGGGNWQLDAGHYEAAVIALEIIAPRAGLTTANRYYKQYPGIEYRVPVVVLGGSYPFKYELTAAPSGMTIGSEYGDTDYGIIVWANPVTSGSPHSVQVTVTDQQGATATVSWTLTVQTSGFLFIDSVNGSDGNAGTLASPKQTIEAFYTTNKNTDESAGSFVYYRTGTYNWADAILEDGYRIAMVGNHKPQVHIAYPGETATHSVSGATPWWYQGNSNVCFSGITFADVGTNNHGKGIVVGSDTSNVLLFENTFLDNTLIGSDTNHAAIFFSNEGGTGQYIAISGNDITVDGQVGPLLIYYLNKVVIENNVLTNTGGSASHGFYCKTKYSNVSIRGNTLGSGTTGRLFRLDGYDATSGPVEVCYNYGKTTSASFLIGLEANSNYDAFNFYRNTFDAPYGEVANVTGMSTTMRGNVIKHSGTYTNGLYLNSTSQTATFQNNELNGTAAYIDSNGLLTGSYRTSYLGTRGHEIA